jgi:DNA polymerase/3'-5' exonuclease PolX
MKFYELEYLFNKLLDDVKKSKIPTLRYIIIAYNNVLRKLSESFSDNEKVTEKKIKSLELTENMETKLIKLMSEIIPKSEIKQIDIARNKNKLKYQLDSLLGIGVKKAQELVELGLTDIKQLHSKKWYSMLNTDTQMVITHNPLRYIAHEDIKKIESKLVSFSKGNSVLVGSYRRKKPFSRDIDILFLPISGKTIEGYLTYLKKTFNDNLWIYANGEDKVSMIIQPYSDNSELKYKCDIFITNQDNFYSYLLYSTGSKENNIRMRARAKSMGLLLNQNGIFRGKKRINTSEDNEEKLFEILGMKYLIPEMRSI